MSLLVQAQSTVQLAVQTAIDYSTVASNSRLVIFEQATELCDELQSPTCTFAISIAALQAWSHHVRAITQ